MGLTTGWNEAIRWHRRSLDLSQRDLGKLLGVNFNTVGNWESGRTTPNIEQLMKIAQLFGVQEQELLHPPERKKVLVE